MKKISILGILAIISTSAMAETVPSNGVMSNDTTYDKSCNNTTLGTYTGPANMTAQYTANTYNCPAGQYLVVGDANTDPKCETCPTGSYCPGTGDITYTDKMKDTGKNLCLSYRYNNSDAGATSAGECYTACVIGDVPHATGVTGKSYANGTNTCEATGCENGYAVANAKSVLNSVLNAQEVISYAELDPDGDGIPNLFDPDDDGDGIPDTGDSWGMVFDKMGITVVGDYVCAANPNIKGAKNNQLLMAGWEDGFDYENDNAYCYCNITGYISRGSSKQLLNSSWVYNDQVSGNMIACGEECASSCFERATSGVLSQFRKDLFDSIDDVNVCKANTIELKWDGVTDAGDAATCSYSGDLKTPATAPTKKGYTFTGWRVNK